jgi:O-antigen ligase
MSAKTKILLLLLAAYAILLVIINWQEKILLGIIPVSIVIVFTWLYQEKFFIPFSIVTFLAFPSNVSQDIRLLIQIINFSCLFYLFFKKYALSFERWPKFPKNINLYFAAFLIVMFISSIFSSNLLLGINQIVRTILFLLLVYFYLMLLWNDEKNKIIITSFIITGFIYIVYVFIDFSNANFDLLLYNQQMLVDLGDKFLHKNTLSNFFLISLCLLFPLLFYKEKKVSNSLIILSSLFLFSALVITNSRTSIASLFLAVLVILYLINKQYFKRTLISFLFLPLITFYEPVSDFIDIYFRVDEVSNGRDWIYESTVNVISDNYILGTGPAGVKPIAINNMPYLFDSFEGQFLIRHLNSIEFGHAHNFYLFYLSEMGIAGLFLSIILIVIFYQLIKKAYNVVNRNSINYYLITGISAAGISLFIRGLFEWGGILSYGMITNDLPFWLLIVTLIIIIKAEQNKALVLATEK